MSGMAGLVLGISVRDKPGSSRVTLAGRNGAPAVRDIRLFMQSSPAFSPPGTGLTLHTYAFVEQRGAVPPAVDSVPARTSPLILKRGEPVRITV